MPSSVFIRDVPFFPQKQYQCGPAAAAMILNWSGITVGADALVSMVYTPARKGSLQTAIIGATRRHGRLAYPLQAPRALLHEIAAGHPVIVLQNLGLAWLPRWHYAVVVGYDLPAEQVILHTGVSRARRVNLSTFMRTWRRSDYWGVLALPVARLPADVQVLPYLKAVLGLEQAGRVNEALEAYELASRHWPDEASALIAWGNALYTAGRVARAGDAFQRAVTIDPGSAIAFNNLAHVLADQGRWDQARAMAQQAVLVGGAQIDLFRDTLREIELRQKAQ